MNRVVVITGASAGIGEAIARGLGTRGERLILASRSGEALDRVASDTVAPTHVVQADVRLRADVERIRDEAISTFGGIDVWINNAGRGIVRPCLDLSDDDLDEMISVNVKSALYGMQAVVPHFVERGRGHIINISSFLGRVPVAPLRSAYSAAKAALNTLTANIRVDLQRTHPGIHVSLVMPGLVATDFARHAIGSTGVIPAGPIGSPMAPQTPQEIATIVADLIDRPAAEVYTNPASRALASRYFDDVGGFEAEAYALR
jgi:short-subunit dehydrogenase